MQSLPDRPTPTDLAFGVLGPVEVRLDGQAVAVGGPRVRALLAMLLLDAGNVVGTDRLIDGLYGEDPPGDAANALQSQVSRLRRGLGNGALVAGHPAGYRLAVDREDVDVHRFERLAGTGRAREALELWRGPALADVSAPFAAGQVARLEERRAGVAEDCAEAEVASGEYAAAARRMRGLIADHPLRERARGLLMRALYGSGRQAEALEVYEEARTLLADELGADPSAELAEVHVAILRGSPALRRDQVLSELPAQLTSFVGREQELERVGRTLAEGRLVTLLGPGGVGKTRLALEAAAREEGEVCFVDLSPVGDGAEVPKAVLGALGLRESGMRPGTETAADPVERILTALDGRRMLLVLDNCEHVIEAAARLAHRLLGARSGLRILATSREALGITGESLRPLPPLPLPPDGAAAGEAAAYPAVRLFADRAAAVRPDFEVDAENTEAVLRICAALDGLPLAIELAAARLRALPVQEVARRLDDRFRLLSRGDRVAAPRHQTLRAVVEWSWDLLDEAERTLARRLTVFAGGATLETVEAVCGVGEADDALVGLVDKSLLQTDGTRYRMLQTIRAFCAERLEQAGEGDRLREAHAAYFLGLARQADPHLRGGEQLEWLARLAAEHANLHAALRRCVRDDPATALHLVAALSWYWWLRGRIEGGPLSADLLERVGLKPPEGLDEEYILCVTNAISAGASGPGTAAALDLATEKMAALQWQVAYPPTLVLWALTAGPERTDIEAHDLQIGRDAWSSALLHMSDGFLRQFRGELAGAEEATRRALDGFRALGDRWGIANSLDPMSQLASRLGDRPRAMALLNEAIELIQELGALEEHADLLCRRAEIFIRDGDLDAACDDFESSADLGRRAGVPDKVAAARCGLGDVARLRGDLDTARRLYAQTGEGFTTERFIASATRVAASIGLGWIALAEGDAEQARARLRRALEISTDHPVFMNRVNAVVGLAGAALLDGDGDQAGLLLGAAGALHGVRIDGDPDAERIAAGVRALIGDAAYETARMRGTAMTLDDLLPR
ncbi:BTAD domain-containing putative transcriptional regulator [Actinomadura sp. 9N407]|uniref:BTAD domain-containing putative transcriptional regulator n=1 Tax=Actinomadura sp. 9N407 TaxID=3375154 RepID=UPI00378AD878